MIAFQNKLLYRLRHAVFGIAGGAMKFGDVSALRFSVLHYDADARVVQHFEVVVIIADCHDFILRDAVFSAAAATPTAFETSGCRISSSVKSSFG